MAKLFPVVASVMLAACSHPPAVAPLIPAPGSELAPADGSVLVWSDEFLREGLPDSARWDYETHRNRAGWYNGELQYYARARAANSRVEGGRLIIEAHRETLSTARYNDWSGQAFTSARLRSRQGAAWRHGFFEVRAKLPCRRGGWPAGWLFPVRQLGPWGGGEIDIFELVGHEPNVVHQSVHTRQRNFARGNHFTSASPVDACATFHDYQVDWSGGLVRFGIDGRETFRAPAQGVDGAMYLILNLAVGGTWAGSAGIDENGFPLRMEIDHVRVYQRQGVGKAHG